MTREIRIYEHPSFISNCMNCQSIRVKSKDKQIVSTKCSRYNQAVDTHAAFNGGYPKFCKLPGDNMIDRDRIYPDPIKIYSCSSCPAFRRDPSVTEAPFRFKCFECDEDQEINFKEALDGIFPKFCKLKIKKRGEKT
jgi:hypothetical protein